MTTDPTMPSPLRSIKIKISFHFHDPLPGDLPLPTSNLSLVFVSSSVQSMKAWVFLSVFWTVLLPHLTLFVKCIQRKPRMLRQNISSHIYKTLLSVQFLRCTDSWFRLTQNLILPPEGTLDPQAE